MPYASATGVELWFERMGDGPPLLLLPGTGSELRRRPNLLDLPLVQRFDTVAFDYRGQGESSSPPPPYDMADYAADAAAVVDALGWDRFAVFGVSFGGMVAQEVAIRLAARVERLVLACTSSGGAGGSSYPLHELQALEPDERARTALAVSDTRYDRAWQEANPDEAAALLEFAARTGGDPNPDQLDARRRHDTWDRLGAITAPTLVMAGRTDGIAPVANSEALAERIPDARLEVFDGGHLFLISDRAALPAAEAFLRG